MPIRNISNEFLNSPDYRKQITDNTSKYYEKHTHNPLHNLANQKQCRSLNLFKRSENRIEKGMA